MTNAAIQELVRLAWQSVAAPPRSSVRVIDREFGERAFKAFAGIAPMSVDIDSAGFHASRPLFDLPPVAAAAYLGTFLLSILCSLDYQEKTGIHDDIFTRPHLLFFLMQEEADRLIERNLNPIQTDVLKVVTKYLISRAKLIHLDDIQVARLSRFGN